MGNIVRVIKSNGKIITRALIAGGIVLGLNIVAAAFKSAVPEEVVYYEQTITEEETCSADPADAE